MNYISRIERLAFFLVLLLIFPTILLAQKPIEKKKPRVALVLSGGGAKGIAHIPILQVLDSLNIVPDLVVGNSMGSIVGGLYAMGYSGDSIEKIAKNANWDELIGGSVSLDNVSVEEKNEFGRYLVGTGVKESKIKITPFLLNDQNLRAFLSNLTYPVYKNTDFDKLAIPFRTVATDIVNGKEVILDKGDLAFAMRASMSIPGAFMPVPYENTLLIDGGVLNNFPVDIAKNLNVDIIIGSDVGGGMEPKEKLDNIVTLLFQTGMLHSNLKNPENKALCDILIDHTPNLTFSTGDFNSCEDIYEEGKIATIQNLQALVDLSKKLKGFKQLTHELPTVEEEIVLDTIIYNNISRSNLALVKARTNIKANKKYIRQDILEGINRAMGTTIFSHITFSSITAGSKKGLELNVFEKSKHQINGALHYDNYHGVGLIMNYTGRNIIGHTSRTLVTLDIAEEPRFRIQHQKNFGSDREWWWSTEFYGQQIEQDVFISGESVENMKYRFFDFNNQINRNINSLKSYVGMGVNYQNTHLKPKVDPKYNANVFELNKYDYYTTEIDVHYIQNSFNRVFFPTNGFILKGSISRSLKTDIHISFYNSDLSNISGSTNNFSKLKLEFEKRFLLNDNTTAIMGARTGLTFQDYERDKDVSFTNYGVGAKYFLGGVALQPRNENFVFPGLYEGELLASQFINLNLGLQMKTGISKVYITPHFNVASVGFDNFNDYFENAFRAKGKWEDSIETSFLLSSGATLSYNSLLGPINLDLSWVDNINKVRFFIGIGFNLNRSN
jgi:NTE family protein